MSTNLIFILRLYDEDEAGKTANMYGLSFYTVTQEKQ